MMRGPVALVAAAIVIAASGDVGAETNDGNADGGAPVIAAPSGVAVLAKPGAEGAAWTLAQAVYANDALRPRAVDEAHARALVGEPQPADAPRDRRDLAEMRGAIRGDDAPSRALLKTIANSLGVRGIVVVEMVDGRAHARLFLADAGAFDAARYEPEGGASSDGGAAAPTVAAWSGTVASIARVVPAASSSSAASSGSSAAPPASSASPQATAPALAAPSPTPLATRPVPPAASQDQKPTSSHPFYASPWFWGALGSAAFAGAAVYFATRDSAPGTIHLQMQVPK